MVFTQCLAQLFKIIWGGGDLAQLLKNWAGGEVSKRKGRAISVINGKNQKQQTFWRRLGYMSSFPFQSHSFWPPSLHWAYLLV